MSGVELPIYDNEALDISRRDLRHARQKIADLEADRTALEKEREGLRAQLDATERELFEWRERAHEARTRADARIAVLEAEVREAAKSAGRLSEMLAAESDEHARTGEMRRRHAAEATALRTRIADLTGETAFLAQRVAWHLAHGCDTAAKARELALAEWGVGVMGGGA